MNYKNIPKDLLEDVSLQTGDKQAQTIAKKTT